VAPGGTALREEARSGKSSPSSSASSYAPAAKEAAASWQVGATIVKWKCGLTTFLEGGTSKSYAHVFSRLSAPDNCAEWLRDGKTWGSAGAPIYAGVRVEPVAMRPCRSSTLSRRARVRF
jgi:hypothetical protein